LLAFFGEARPLGLKYPLCHSRPCFAKGYDEVSESGNPYKSGSRIKCGMTIKIVNLLPGATFLLPKTLVYSGSVKKLRNNNIN